MVFDNLKDMPKADSGRLIAAILVAVCVCSSSLHSQQPVSKKSAKPPAKPEESTLTHQILHQIQVLPYYSVFDYVTFSLDGSKVTLTGYALRPKLRADAEAEIKSMEGVTEVTNRIELLPKTPADDEARRAVYRAIFEDARLQVYAVSEVPAIHIILKDGAVTLEGTVGSESDKSLATARASAVSGVTSVKNNLSVHGKGASPN